MNVNEKILNNINELQKIMKEEIKDVKMKIDFIKNNSDYLIYYTAYKSKDNKEMFFGNIIEKDYNQEIFLYVDLINYDYHMFIDNNYSEFKNRINEIYDKLIFKQKIENKLEIKNTIENQRSKI